MMGRALTRRCAIAALLTILLFAGRAAAQTADDCTALGGEVGGVDDGSCIVSTVVTRADGNTLDGAFDIDGDLIITDTGALVVPPAAGGNTLTLKIAGDLIVQTDGRIDGRAFEPGPVSGVGARLDIVAAGNVELAGTVSVSQEAAPSRPAVASRPRRIPSSLPTRSRAAPAT
jgi:hypothetical protein